MKQFRLNVFYKHYRFKLIMLVTTLALISSSACTPPTPPPPPPPPNQPPIIESITAEKEIPILAETQVVAKASDADGDILTYQWSADGGTIEGGGNTITWTAPATTDNYTIKVTVSDGRDTVTQSTTIATIDKPNQPPVISGLIIDGSPPATENRVKPWTITTIHCKAQDPDGDNLNYLWRATCGKIEGEGGTVTWIAPGANGSCTITVMVNDGKDGKAEASIVFKVACCGGGF